MTELRADARRNLERVLEAAAVAFAEQGPEVSVDEIARRAGVGHATVFRRFPTKDALITAVVQERVNELVAAAEEAAADDDAGAAWRRFLLRVVELKERDRRLLECFDRCAASPEVERLHELGAYLVKRAQAAGAVRPDVTPEDVQTMFEAVLRSAPPGQWRRYAEVVLDGLRP